MLVTIFKASRKIVAIIKGYFYTPIGKLFFYLNGINYGKGLIIYGLTKINVTRRGEVQIGDNVKINSGDNYNIIGRQQKTIFWVEGKLKIGNNTGLSSTAIICNHEIEIGENVVIGGNTVIYDTDFHSLKPDIRIDKTRDKQEAKKGKVTIENNVFIGSHSTILKGVTIGENSVIGACSLVSRDIPPNEIWGGNPIVFIKKI
jgi:acetyltransferase-like isoleucine patch superfamily enzyme